jgi:hypothetical protein
MSRLKVRRSLFATVAVLALAAQSLAAPIVATDRQTGIGPFTPSYAVSATDLIHSATPSSQSGNFQEEAAGGTSVLTSGAFGTISGGTPVTTRS